MKFKLPTKTEIKEKIPDEKELEELFYKAYRLKRGIELLEEDISKKEQEMKVLSRSPIMRQYRTKEMLIKTTIHHIKAYQKKLIKLFDIK